MNFNTLQCGTIMALISHPAMWHVPLESWQWIHQVAAPCNVIRDSGMTCRWIRPVAALCNVTRSSGIMTLNVMMQCDRLLCGPYDRIRHVILRQSAKFYPNRTTLSRKKNDVVSIFKMADLIHLGFYGSNNGFFEKPMWIMIRTLYYIQGAWGDENILAVLYVSLCYGPYTLL